MLSLANLSHCGSTLLNAFKSSTSALSAAFITPVRYRYHEDKHRILQRRWGYTDWKDMQGTLPRVQTCHRLPKPPYVPKNAWSERRALFGQNDYIDILGDDESISPVKFAYGVPGWLRGFKGSEYQMLLRKRQYFGRTYASAYPLSHQFLRKRLKFLYRKINHHTKSFMDPRVLRR